MSPLERFRYIRTLRTPGPAKCVLLILATHADKAGLCWPSQTLLSAETGYTDRTVRKALAFLASNGLIIQRRRKGQSSAFNLTLEQFKATAVTPEARSALPRKDVPTEVPSRRGPRKPKPSLIDSPRFDASAPPDRRCPSCGAAAANLERGGYCFLHRAKAHGQL